MPNGFKNNLSFFYCPMHQLRFHATEQAVVQCEQGGHALGNGFPDKSWWEYCCDCGTFWPFEPGNGTFRRSECLVCDRQIAKRYLCDNCQVVSIESSALVRRKTHFIDTDGSVKPGCPGCASQTLAKILEHDCTETTISFLTARDACPFCANQIGPSISQPAASVPFEFCPFCGTQQKAINKFCKRCGKRQPVDRQAATARDAEAVQRSAAEVSRQRIDKEERHRAEEQARIQAEEKQKQVELSRAEKAERLRAERQQAAEAERLRLERERAAEAERLRVEQERAAEAERLRVERERAADAERFRLEQERAAETERLRVEEQQAAEGERRRAEKKRAAEAEHLRLAQQRADEKERLRLEQERGAEAERARIEQERAAGAEGLRLEQEQAAEAERLRVEQERATEEERARVGQERAAEERLPLEQQPAAEAERRFEEAWRHAEDAEEVQLTGLDVVRSIQDVAATPPADEFTEPQDTGEAPTKFRRDASTFSVGQDEQAKTSAYLPSWALTPEAPPKRRAQWMIAAVIAVISLSAVVVIAMLLNRQRATSGPPQPKPSPTTVPPSNMVYVPGGEFVMGTDAGDEYERPAHKVTVKPFFIDSYEVTCEEYEKFLKATGHKPPPGWVNGTYSAGAARRPVTGVDWDDANTYAQWVKKRLPTEEEWEFAARGVEGWKYSWGNDWRQGLANANKVSRGLADVGQFKAASPFRIVDMIGNAWEWTSTPIHSYPGGKISEDQLPEVERTKMKTIRGGCYLSDPTQATTTYRRGWPLPHGPNDFNQTGFRCALEVSSKN